MINYERYSKDYESMYKILKIEYKDLEKYYNNARFLYCEMSKVIEKIGLYLDIEEVKKGYLACCCKDNEYNPILKFLKEHNNKNH